MRKGCNVGTFMAQMLISLIAWKAQLAQWYLLSVFIFSAPFSTLSSLPLSVFQPSCHVFEAPYLFVSYCLDFPPSLILSPALSPSIFISICFIFPWRSLVFPHYRGSPTATCRCATLRGLCVDQMCACMCAIWCVFDFLPLLHWKSKDDKSFFISSPFSESSPVRRCIFKEIWLNLKRIPLFADLDKCYHSN